MKEVTLIRLIIELDPLQMSDEEIDKLTTSLAAQIRAAKTIVEKGGVPSPVHTRASDKAH